MHVNYNTDVYIKFRKVPLTTKSQISISYFVEPNTNKTGGLGTCRHIYTVRSSLQSKAGRHDSSMRWYEQAPC